MTIALIAAMDKNRLIGSKNQIPWHLPDDLRHFKQLTMGKPVIMGRKTWESIGKPLPNRFNIVVTRQPNFSAPGATVVDSMSAALHAAQSYPEIMIIGGAQLYAESFDLADRLYLTLIDHEFVGDSHFPSWNAEEWRIVQEEQHAPTEKNPYRYTFQILERKKIPDVRTG